MNEVKYEFFTRKSDGEQWTDKIETPLSAVLEKAADGKNPQWISIFELLLQAGARPHQRLTRSYYCTTEGFNATFEILKCADPYTKATLMRSLLTLSQHPVDLNLSIFHRTVLGELCLANTKGQQQENLAILKIIIELSPQLDVDGPKGNETSPLFHAVEHGFIDAVHLLHEHKADLDRRVYNHTPTLWAARYAPFDLLRILLNLGGKPFNDETSLLHMLYDYQYSFEAEKTLFDIALEFKTPPEVQSQRKPSILFRCGSQERFVRLLEAKADAKTTTINLGKPNYNVLHHRLDPRYSMGIEKVIPALDNSTLKFLLEMQSYHGHQPLHHIIMLLGHHLVDKANDINELLKGHRRAGVPIDLKNRDGESPLSHAIYNYRTLEILLQNGANMYAEIESPFSPLSDLQPNKESKQEPKRRKLSEYYDSPDDYKQVCDIFKRELQYPSHPDNRNRIRRAFLSGMHPKLGRDSSILRCSRNPCFEQKVFGKIFDFLFFKKEEKATSSKDSSTLADFPIEETAQRLLLSLGVKEEKMDYMQLTPHGNSPTLAEFEQQFRQKAFTTKRYLFGDIPIDDYHVPFVIDFDKRKVYCCDPFLNRHQCQTTANKLLNQAMGKFARLERCDFVTPPDRKDCTKALPEADSEINNKTLSCMFLVGMILKSEGIQPSDPVFQSLVIDVESGSGIGDKSQQLPAFQQIIAKVFEELQHLKSKWLTSLAKQI